MGKKFHKVPAVTLRQQTVVGLTRKKKKKKEEVEASHPHTPFVSWPSAGVFIMVAGKSACVCVEGVEGCVGGGFVVGVWKGVHSVTIQSSTLHSHIGSA